MDRKISFTEYCKAKAIVAEYELERIDNARFCKSCQDEVTGTQCGSCGNPCLQVSDTFSFQEMMEHEMKISEYEAERSKRQRENINHK